MAAVPVILNGVMYPKGRSAGDKPEPAVFCGYLSIQGLTVGGGPVIPDPDPPHPAHPIELPPDPPDPPIDVPPQPPSGPQVALVIKPAPVTGGWGLAGDGSGGLKWFFVPAQGGAGPKR